MFNILKRLTTASLLILAAGICATHQAMATDVEAVVTDQAAPAMDSAGQFVRIGLNKSIVVRLPAEARDVIVGDPATVDAIVRRKNMAYIFARGIGQSNVFFFDANGNQILNLDVEVALDSLALRKLMQRAMPGSRITVDTVNKDVILGGMAANASEAKQAVDLAQQFNADGKVINTIRVAGDDQVMLKVKMVEIQRDTLKQLGVDLQAVLTTGEKIFNLASLNPFNLSDQAVTGNSGLGFSDSSGGDKIKGILRALERDGLSRTLAEPNLTAVSGQSASFHAGGEIPFSSCKGGSATNVQCTVEFKKYGVSLNFTPTVLSEGRINLKLMAEVSELSAAIAGIPSVDSRTTETVLELPSGGSMMIAGLIKETTRQQVNGLPGLKRLPILGSLFRSREFLANESELVVIVTPYLVTPVAQNKLLSPDKNFNPADERQSLFFGKLHKTYGSSGKAPVGNYNGNVGFIVE
jgi:pilus assembly protein CpaC